MNGSKELFPNFKEDIPNTITKIHLCVSFETKGKKHLSKD